jgi:hypothetical protein
VLRTKTSGLTVEILGTGLELKANSDFRYFKYSCAALPLWLCTQDALPH